MNVVGGAVSYPTRRARQALARVAALFLALFQLLLGPALSISDAEAQARSASPLSAHLEDRSRAECRLAHDDRCVVCQQLSTVASTGPQPRFHESEAGRALGAGPHLPERRVSSPGLRPPSRAPPSLA